MDRWKNQKNFVIVMCEKDAVSNIIAPICRKFDVTFLANKGYSSQSIMYKIYNNISFQLQEGKEIRCIYIGDFDPSGLDMDRDIKERMQTFLQNDWWNNYDEADEEIEESTNIFDEIAFDFPLNRIALTKDQIDQYNPPVNPAKVTDSRFDKYKIEHGESSWELDALEPSVLGEIVESAILQFVDQDEFDRVAEKESQIKSQIREFAGKWRD